MEAPSPQRQRFSKKTHKKAWYNALVCGDPQEFPDAWMLFREALVFEGLDHADKRLPAWAPEWWFEIIAKGDTVRALAFLIAGFDVDCLDEEDSSAFYLATERGDYPMIRLLAQAGADVNFAGMFGYLPIHIAAKEGYADVVGFLMTCGVKVDAPGTPYGSPLGIASFFNQPDVARVLIKAGANTSAIAMDGKAVLDMARSDEMRDLLRRAGAKSSSELGQS
jgi:hypothetical protein